MKNRMEQSLRVSGKDNESGMEQSLRVPGRENESMWPPVGQLSFHEITAMSEKDVDARIAQHLQGQSPFKKENQSFVNNEQRLKIKQVILTGLEGITPSNPSFQKWYDPHIRLAKVADSIWQIRSKYASNASKERIWEVRKHIAYDTEMLAPRKETSKLYESIIAALARKGLPTIALQDILREPLLVSRHGPIQEKETIDWNLHQLLQLFELTIMGITDENIAERMHTTAGSVMFKRSSRFSDEAKKLMQKARGFKHK